MDLQWIRMDDIVARLVPDPYTMTGLLERASDELGIRLFMLAKVRRGTPLTGMVVRDGNRGVILVPADATEEFQVHIFAHELWHLMRGHSCTQQLNGYRTTVRSRFREACCERFARKVGLEIKRQRADSAAAVPSAARGLAEAFGVRAW
ncbi:hypothetical protein HLB23_21770 [Nocardia uniformis]|uniref:IrrE N-terminal-like domain-containing protein n=1 Tax=Nocardia uniformis TaxID=53432 RepID=A0A849C830_9NOCA|nr:hypothetical protein [Nocardia uniformis]NNH72455.1 hypothetical protein [Nocardia uniformis]